MVMVEVEGCVVLSRSCDASDMTFETFYFHVRTRFLHHRPWLHDWLDCPLGKSIHSTLMRMRQ